MRSVLVIGVGALLLASCSSATSSSAPTCSVGGTWSLHYNRDSQNGGDCPASVSWHDEVITIAETSATSADVSYQGAAGGCPASIDGCKLTGSCTGGLTNGGQLTRQDSWSFTTSTMGGSSAFGFQNGPNGPICTYNAVVSGTKK